MNCIPTSDLFQNFKNKNTWPLLKAAIKKEAIGKYRLRNLPSLLKVFEKLVFSQLNEGFTSNNPWPRYQSAYCKGCDTKIVLLYCLHKICLLLVVLDKEMDLTGAVKLVFESLLENRTIQVMVARNYSSMISVIIL